MYHKYFIEVLMMLLDIVVNNYGKNYANYFNMSTVLVNDYDHNNSYKRKHLSKTNHTSG